MGKKEFLKLFKKAIPNYDETICHFEFGKYKQVNIKFVLDNKLVLLKAYRDQYYINLWRNHFIEYFNTKTFDYNGYWKFYSTKKLVDGSLESFFTDNDIYKVPLCKEFGSDFYEHSKELGKLHKIRESKNKNLGIKLIPKPVNNEKITEL